MTRISSCLVFLLLLVFGGQAQFPVRVQVNVVQPVPPYLPQLKADISGNRSGQLNQDISSHLSIILSYTGRSQQHIKLAGSIERVAPSPMGVSLRPDFQPAQPIMMGPQQPMLSLTKDMLQSAFGNFSENSLVYTNMDLNTLRQNGIDYKLPEGTYRVCVTAYDYDRAGFSAPLSAPGTGCAYFTICYTAAAPQLILPVTTMLQSNSGFQDFVPHSSQIQFLWTPPATTCGTPIGALNYDLEIRRVFPGQTVTDAQSNPYVFHQQNIPSTSFYLDTFKYAHVLVTGQQYTVRVKANFMPMIGSPLEVANQGYSQIGAFTYQPPSIFPGKGLAANGNPDSSQLAGTPVPAGSTILPGGYIVPPYSPGNTCPATTSITNTNPLAGGIADQDLTIGGFRLHIDQATQKTDGSYTGTGYIVWHPFAADIKLSVGFDSLRANTDKVVYAGSAATTTAGGFPSWSSLGADPVSSLAGMTDANLTSLTSRLTDGQHLINTGLGGNEITFPLGLNTMFGGAPFTLAIMGISFRPACNNMDVLFNLDVADLGGSLTLAGTGFQIDPNKVLLADKGGVLYLPQDHAITAGGLSLKFDGCPGAGGGAVDTSKGVYVQWDDVNGLGKVVVNADLQFKDAHSIVAVDNTDKRLSTPATIHARFAFTDWNDWVASATLNNDFELAGLPGFPIHSDGLFYDHSNKQNPVNIKFPTGYIGAQDQSFQGLYIPNLTMSLPGNFTTFSGSKPGNFGFQYFILDNNGVSTVINGNNILDISTGSLGGWAFSIDKISIGVVQNNFQSGMSMNGQIKLPVSTTGLQYTCNLNSSGSQVNYQFVVQPSGELDVPLWVAKLTLDANSSLVIANDANGMAVKTHLNGSIGVDISVSNFPKVSLPGLSFQDMAMANRADTTAGAAAGFYFYAGSWSLGGSPGPSGTTASQSLQGSIAASGPSDPSWPGTPSAPSDAPAASPDEDGSSSQGSVAGFSISLSDFSPYFKPQSLHQFEAGIYFNLNVNVGFGDASVISGTARMGLIGLITIPTTSAPTVGFEKVDCDSVSLDGGIGPVTVKGNLAFINGDHVYGDGVKGSLYANFPFAQLEAAAQFGTTLGTDGTSGGPGSFHYWAVGGSIFLQTGILIGPGLTVNGFGGGIYHNMSLTNPTDADIQSHSTTPGTIPMVPQVNTTGLQAELIVAVIQPAIVNASLTLSVEIHNGALSLMELDGSGFAITDPPGNADAMLKVKMTMQYDFVNQVFDMYVGIDFQFLISSAHAPIWIHGGPDGDYLYIGRPDQGDGSKVSLTLINIGDPNGGNLDLYVFLGGTAYFDAGTELPGFPPLPADITGHLDKSNSDNAVSTMLQMLNTKGNPGFMFGADVQGHIRLDLLFLYAQVDADLGFDVAFERPTTIPPGCMQSDGTFGIANWYGTGQFFAYFNLNVGLHVDAWFFSGDVSLVQEEAWAILQAGLPNPTWVNGDVHVQGSALGGLVSVSGDFPFSFGTQCNIQFNPLDEIQMITDAGPADSADVFATPYAAYSVPMNGSDYPIQVPADQDHSQPYTRTFRFYQDQFNLYKEQKDGTDSLVNGTANGGAVSTSLDGLGSSLYPKDMLQPHTRYKVYIQCGVTEIVNGQPQSPAGGPVTQDSTFYFTTGAAPDQLVVQNIDYSYPIASQRYLLQNEFGRRGTIKMARWQYDLLPQPSTNVSMLGGYNYLVYFLDSDGDTLKSSFTLNQANNSLDFPIPSGLKNSTIYDLQVWVIPRKNFSMQMMAPTIKQQQQQITNQITTTAPVQNPSAGQKAGVLMSTATINKNVVVKLASTHAPGSIPIFTLKFQTSQYNSFADKMAAYGQWNSKAEDNFRDISLYSQTTAPEEFDEFEMNGYNSTCTLCNPAAQGPVQTAMQQESGAPTAAPSTPKYPAMFSAVIPWNNNAQNDKYASDNLYANTFLMAVAGITVDLGAANVRDLMRPVYSLSTAGIPYQPKLPALPITKNSYAATTINQSFITVQPKPTTGNSGSGNPVAFFHSAGAMIGLPVSYLSGSTQPSSKPDIMSSMTVNSALGSNVVSGPRLLWQHDKYIYADYQLLQKFAVNFLGNQQNTIWLPSGSIPVSLIQALTYGNSVTLATGEYGSITADPDRYSVKWNDPTLTQLAHTIQGLPFQPYPPTAGRPLQFTYQYPFCQGCSLNSNVSEQFSYGNVLNFQQPVQMKISNVNPNIKLKKP
jgi:hypothetical protein